MDYRKVYVLIYLSLNSIVSLIVSLGQLPPSRHSFPLSMCSSSLFPLTSVLILGCPLLLPGCFLAFLIVPWPPWLLPGCSWLPGYVCSWLLLAAPGCSLGMPLCSGGPVAKRSSANVCAGPVQRVCGGLGERSGLRGCAAAKRGLPKRSPPEAVLPRSGPLPMRCGLSDAPLSQRSSAVAVICRSGGLRKHAPAQRVLDGYRTTEIRLRVCLQTSA